MQSISYYADQAARINQMLVEHLNSVRADNVIDEGESAATQELSAELARKLNHLKKELSLDIRQTRSDYRLKITNADTQEKKILRVEMANALAPYERIKLHIDRALLHYSELKESFTDSLPELDEAMQAVMAVSEEMAETTGYDGETGEEIPLMELYPLVEKWNGLFEQIERNLRRPHLSIGQVAHYKGAQKALAIAIADLGERIGVG